MSVRRGRGCPLRLIHFSREKKSPCSVSPSQSLSLSLASVGSSQAPCSHRCILPPPKLTTPPPPLVRVAPPRLLHNPAPLGCLVAAGHRHCPCRWRLGARAGASQVVPGRAKGTHERAQCWWCSRATALPLTLTLTVGINQPQYNECFNCFRCMLQVFCMDVAKIDRDVTHVAMAIHVCCKRLFQMFYMCFSDVCCKCFFWMLHMFHTYVASVFIWMLHMFF
jgi:hypothetical protein